MPDATAFGIRREQFHFVAIASWNPDDNASPHLQWARRFWAAMQPWAAGGAYMNILNHDEADRVREAYGENYNRLAKIKRVYDPSNIFKTTRTSSPRTHEVV